VDERIRLSGGQEIRVQVIRTAGYQVKGWRAENRQRGNIEGRIGCGGE